MKSNYERNRFRIRYLFASLIFILVISIIVIVLEQELSWKIGIVSGSCLVFSIVLYQIVFREINQAYGEMETISEAMTEVMEQGVNPIHEQYLEGTVGILHTNFYKMVGVLQESKNKELQEKVFLRDIISDISHQLKTPLASLNIFVDLLIEDKLEMGKKQQILTEAQNQLNRMEWMVLSMLKLARIEAGAIVFEKMEMPLETILLQAAESVQFLIKERKQNLNISCESNATLLCDGPWLIEAIINLLKNASDYSATHKTIDVEVETSHVYTRIYIKDEGVGIKESELPNIFKRFYRINQEVNPNSVGIGLSLTKSIVEGMGGSIHVKSEEGKYTWFIITFVR